MGVKASRTTTAAVAIVYRWVYVSSDRLGFKFDNFWQVGVRTYRHICAHLHAHALSCSGSMRSRMWRLDAVREVRCAGEICVCCINVTYDDDMMYQRYESMMKIRVWMCR